MKTITKTTEQTKNTAEYESNLGFKMGMLGKFVSMTQANINKGKGNQKNRRN